MQVACPALDTAIGFACCLSLTLNRWQKLWQAFEQPACPKQLRPADENYNKSHSSLPTVQACLPVPLAYCDSHIQTNTRGMLIMPEHDISKISHPMLFKQLSIQRTSPAAPRPVWPIQLRGLLFSVQGGLVHPSPSTLFPWEVISVPTGQTGKRELCYSLSAADDKRKKKKAFVPSVTHWYRNLSLILGIGCIIF